MESFAQGPKQKKKKKVIGRTIPTTYKLLEPWAEARLRSKKYEQIKNYLRQVVTPDMVKETKWLRSP